MSIRSPHHPSRHVNLFAPRPTPALYRKISYSFVGITIVIAIGALWLSSVRARITVAMKRDVTRVETSIDVSKTPVLGELGGRVVKGTFEKIQEFTIKEGAPVEGIAKGTVKIINAYSQPQTLVEKTRLLTSDGRLYRIEKTVVIPSKQSVQVVAHSDKPGSTYALPIGTKLMIPGLWSDLQKWIYAESVTAFSATAGTANVVRESELKDAYVSLAEAVTAQANKTLRAEAGVGEEWKSILATKILEQKTNVTAGQKTDSFLASVKVEVTAVFYPAKETEALIRQKLAEKLSDERVIVEFDPSRANFVLEQSDAKAATAKIRITAEAITRLTDKSPQFAKAIFFGMSEADASTKLSAKEGVERVTIRIRPSWIHTIPKNPSHVELIVQ